MDEQYKQFPYEKSLVRLIREVKDLSDLLAMRGEESAAAHVLNAMLDLNRARPKFIVDEIDNAKLKRCAQS